MSKDRNAVSGSIMRIVSANALAVSVLPTPVGPTSRNTAKGLVDGLTLARFWMDIDNLLEIIPKASSCPTTRWITVWIAD
jgi:hypothetical protein